MNGERICIGGGGIIDGGKYWLRINFGGIVFIGKSREFEVR